MVDKEEVTLIVYDIWEQVRTKMWLRLCGDWGRAVWLELLALPILAPTMASNDSALPHLKEKRPTLACLSWLMFP